MRAGFYVELSNEYVKEMEKWWVLVVGVRDVYDVSLLDLDAWFVIIDAGNNYVREGRVMRVNLLESEAKVYVSKYEVEWLRGRNIYLELDAIDLSVEKSITNVIDSLSFSLPLIETGVVKLGDEVLVFISGECEPYFEGRIEEVSDSVSVVKYRAYGKGYELTKIFVKKLYSNVAPEDIVKDLVESVSDIRVEAVPTGTILEKYVVDDYVFDAILRLAEGFKYQIRIVGSTLYFEPFGYIREGLVVDKSYCGFDDVKKDTSRLVNDLWLYGSTVTFATEESFTGDGITTEFKVSRSISGGVNVTVNGVEVNPKEYKVRKEEGIIEFREAPEDGASIVIRYEYEVPIVVHVTDDESITKYGKRSAVIKAKYITTFEMCRKFAFEYLRTFAHPIVSVSVTMALPIFTEKKFKVGRKYTVRNKFYGIDDELVLKKINVTSRGTVKLMFGMEEFNIIDWYRKVYERLQELEKIVEAKVVVTEYKLFTQTIDVDFIESFRAKVTHNLGSVLLSARLVPDMKVSIIGEGVKYGYVLGVNALGVY